MRCCSSTFILGCHFFDDLLNAVLAKCKQQLCSNFSTFSSVGGKDFLVGGGMVGEVESEICSICEVLVVGIGYGKDVEKMFRST